MASKIIVFVLVVTVYKVQSHSIYFPNPQSSTSSASANAKASAGATASSSNTEAPSKVQPSSSSQSKSVPVKPSNPNQGIKASPQLQIIPGQGCNLQAYPVSQLRGPIQQRPRNQNCISIPRPVAQASPSPTSPQIQTTPAQLCQPSLTGPASVITSPVSTITIPPTGGTTIIDHSLCNSLANALQMMIANELINSAINNNIIKEGVQLPVVETVVPSFDLATFLQGLNAEQIQASASPKETDHPQTDAQSPQKYDWTAIQNFLNQQGLAEKPTTEAVPLTDFSDLISYLQQDGQPDEQVNQGITSPQQAGSAQSIPQQTAYQDIPQAYQPAAYCGCNVSDVNCNTYPTVPQIVFPEEIPAQLVCNYGYMPTTVPVVSFSVQPCGEGNNFIVGCQC